MSYYALLGSPFLGPEVWEPAAAALRARGHRASVLSSSADEPEAILADYASGLPDVGVVLVPHSNAGLYVAGLAARAAVTAVVFVDALLPGPPPATPVTSPALVGHLRPLADAWGRLPVWTRWWPEEGLADLFADPAQRRAVEAGQRRLPFAYLQAEVPSPAGWERLPAAYLGFGDGYADEQRHASGAGWPLTVLPGRHLHQLVAPAAVADAICDLHGRIDVGV